MIDVLVNQRLLVVLLTVNSLHYLPQFLNNVNFQISLILCDVAVESSNIWSYVVLSVYWHEVWIAKNLCYKCFRYAPLFLSLNFYFLFNGLFLYSLVPTVNH